MAGGLETEWEEPSAASTSGEGVIFVLESAQLEVAKVRLCCVLSWVAVDGPGSGEPRLPRAELGKGRC